MLLVLAMTGSGFGDEYYDKKNKNKQIKYI